MTTSRKIALACVTSAVAIALSIPIYSGALKAYAAAGLSGDVDVNIIGPVSGGGTLQVNVFTPGGLAPASLPINVTALVEVFLNGNPELPDLTNVDFALNGTLTKGNDLLNADDVIAGTQTGGGAGALTRWEGALDLASAGFIPAGIRGGGGPILESSSIARALATVIGYYTGSARAPGNVIGFDDYDSISIETFVYDSADVDNNGDNKPDANGLIDFPSGEIIGTGASGGLMITVWNELTNPPRGVLGATVETEILTAAGLVNVAITAPSLSAIQALYVGYSVYTQGRLVMSVATVPSDLLNNIPPYDPLVEFLPAQGAPPQGLFALANVLLRDPTTGTNPWINVEGLNGAELDASFSGAGIQASLAALGVTATVYMYDYNTSVAQDINGNLLDTADMEGWDVNASTILSRDTVEAGDDEISALIAKGSSIIASNGTPLVAPPVVDGGGGGSNGICFIATAAYGTPLADDVQVLRAVRDSYMLNTAIGAAFVDGYYRVSPPIADAVAENALLRTVVRALLTPVVIVSSFIMAMPGLSVALMLMAGVFVVARLRRRFTQA